MPRPSQKRVPYIKGLPKNYGHHDHEITISRKPLTDIKVALDSHTPGSGEKCTGPLWPAMTSTIKNETAQEPHNKAGQPDSPPNPADYTAATTSPTAALATAAAPDPAMSPADALAARLEARYGIRIPTDAERVAAGLDYNLRPVGGSTDSPESRRYPAWTLDDSLAANTAVVGSLVAEALARADADAIPMRDAVRAARLAATNPADRLFAASA